jgi:hypothetical protein
MKGLLRATAVAFLLAGLGATAASTSATLKYNGTRSIVLCEGPSPAPEWPPSGPSPSQPSQPSRR